MIHIHLYKTGNISQRRKVIWKRKQRKKGSKLLR